MSDYNNMGIVLYVSSGIKGDIPNEQIAGAGVHGYTYYNEVLSAVKGRINYGQEAYYDLMDYKKAKKEGEDEADTGLEDDPVVAKKLRTYLKQHGDIVKLGRIIDKSRTFTDKDGPVDNVYIALTVMKKLLDMVYWMKLTKVTIIENNGIATTLLTKHAEKLKANNWKKDDGSEIAYKELASELFDLYNKVKSETNLKLISIPSNLSEYGRDLAEANQYKAIYAGRSGKPINDFDNASIDVTDPESLKLNSNKVKVDRHPFIQLKHVLFKKYVEPRNDTRFRYHFMSLPSVSAGAKKENEDGENTKKRKDYFDYIGKSDTETIYQVVDISSPIKPIDAVSLQLSTFDKTHYNKLFLGIIAEIYKTDNYYDLITYGGSVFETSGSYSKRLVMKTAAGKLIGNEVSPPRRVKDATFILGEISNILDDYYKGNYDNTGDYCYTDVTSYFYKIDGKKPTINPEFTNQVKKINLTVNYKDGKDIKQLVYGFQVAYDIPPRGLFLHSASADSKVVLITWPEVGLGVRYAVVVKSSDAVCIWCNWYSNIILTKGM